MAGSFLQIHVADVCRFGFYGSLDSQPNVIAPSLLIIGKS
jgi:hypothetical protein